MSKIFVSHNNILSSLGFSSESVVNQIQNEVSGLQLIEKKSYHPKPFYSSLINKDELDSEFFKLNDPSKFMHLEKMLITSLDKVIHESKIKLNNRVGLIISTTKGNIDALDRQNKFPKERAYLSKLGQVIKDFFGFENDAVVISNACVSGILAVTVAKRYIDMGLYDHVFITSGDIVTEFILSGFNSFQAMSDSPCKPYDKNRSGINIGEVAASILVTNDTNILTNEALEILGEGSSNDANHISGPSRTGEGLYRSMLSAFKQSEIKPESIDYISAHGTATLFNDEMEAIALNRMGLENKPLNSLKGYFGHTLGASALLETIVGMHSLYNNVLYKSLGYESLGVSKPLNIIASTRQQQLNTFLKTASGFGGCNTAVIFKQPT